MFWGVLARHNADMHEWTRSIPLQETPSALLSFALLSIHVQLG